MSYCVNCGVELEKSLSACPLCHYPVTHVEDSAKAPELGPYPNRVERIFNRIDRRYGAALASIVLAIPIICSILIDFLTSKSLSWSGYVSGGVTCVFVICLLPLMEKRPNIYVHLLYNTLAILAYLAAIFLVNQNLHAYLTLAMPIAIASSAVGYLWVITLRMKPLRGKLHKPAILILLLALFLISIELILDIGLHGVFKPFWSLIAAVPCLVSAAILVLLEGKRGIKDRIIRRLFL